MIMIPGDPFHTDELDELRAEQRRVLRWIPPWIMDRIADEDRETVPEPEVLDEHRTHAELVFRRFVRDQVLAGEEDLIAKMRRSTEGEMLEAATAPIAKGWNGDLADGARDQYEGSRMSTIDKDTNEAYRIRYVRRALLVAESLSDDV